jgi:hypothetical protein
MTKEPPYAIRQLNMALSLGSSTEEADPSILRLVPDSSAMNQDTWINLEQRFSIEWSNLDDWAVRVQVAQYELSKIETRVVQLEADQNRHLYKPLFRMMSTTQPGMITMLPNIPNTTTFSAGRVVCGLSTETAAR